MTRIILSLSVLFCSLFCLHSQQITEYEYWFDSNSDQRIKVAATSGKLTMNPDVSALSGGGHYLNYRARDDQGRWSAPVTHHFWRVIPNDNRIVRYEYWFDRDVASRKTVSSSNGLMNIQLGVNDLSAGLHFFNYRAQDSHDKWSAPVTHCFFRVLPNDNRIVQFEYWFNKDVESKKTVDASGGIIFMNDMDVNALPVGLHYLNFRAQDARGQWSAPVMHFFYRMGVSLNKIVKYEYWLNNDAASKTTVDGDVEIIDFTMNTSSLADGFHRIAFRSQDIQGAWSAPVTCIFIKYGDNFTEPEQFVDNGKIYQIFDAQLTWMEAADFCERMGGHLAAPVSDREVQFLQSVSGNSEYYWLGGIDPSGNGNWQWQNKAGWDYSNWQTNGANNSGITGFLYMNNTETNTGKWGYLQYDNFPPTNTVGFIFETAVEHIGCESPAYSDTTGDLAWTLCDDASGEGYTLTVSGNGAMPDYDAGAAPWYGHRNEITAVTLKGAITHIGAYAFEECSKLTSVTIPASVASIGAYAFGGCSGLTEIVNQANDPQPIDNSVFDKLEKEECILRVYADFEEAYRKAEGWQDFMNLQFIIGCPKPIASGKTGTLTWSLCPDGTLVVGGSGEMPSYAGAAAQPWASRRNAITAVVIEKGVTTIGNNAFNSCIALTSVTIGESVKSIGSNAFSNCSRLKTITIPESVTSIGGYAFQNCRELITVIFNAINCTSMAGNADPVFYNCINLTEVHIGSKVTGIPHYAFYGFSGLKTVTIPESVTSIGMNAFQNCSELTAVYFNAVNCSTMGSLGAPAFAGCGKLTDVIFGNNVQMIPGQVFYGCSGLTTVTIPESVTYIGYWTFYGCSSLTTVTIPESVTIVGSGAFGNCSSLTKVHFNAINCTNMGSGGSSTVFYNCNRLTEVHIGSEVTNIPDWSFADISGLTAITIPESVTTIRNNVFSGCTALTLIINFATTPQTIDASVFNNVNKQLVTLRVPTGSMDAYRDANVWKEFLNMQEFMVDAPIISRNIDFLIWLEGDDILLTAPPVSNADEQRWQVSANGIDWTDFTDAVANMERHNQYLRYYAMNSVGEAFSNVVKIYIVDKSCAPIANGYVGTLAWRICADGTLTVIPTVSGYGEMPNLYNSATQPWLAHLNLITAVVIEEGVTSIGNGAFRNCPNLSKVSFPESVTEIMDWAFSECRGLTTVTIPGTVTFLGPSAFHNCSELTTVYYNAINCATTTIYATYLVFAGCGKLTNIIIGDGVKIIPDNVFRNCSALQTVNIPASVTSIGNSAFENCSAITALNLPLLLTSIGTSAFQNCGGINSSLIIPDLVTTIGASAFYNCRNITSVDIPNSVTSIGSNAFSGCPLEEVITPLAPSGTGLFTESLVKLIITDECTSFAAGVLSSCINLRELSLPFIGTGVTATNANVLLGILFGTTANGNMQTVTQYYNATQSRTSYMPGGLEKLTVTRATQLGYGALYGCTMLKEIVLPKTLTGVGEQAFTAAPVSKNSIQTPPSRPRRSTTALLQRSTKRLARCISLKAARANIPLPTAGKNLILTMFLKKKKLP